MDAHRASSASAPQRLPVPADSPAEAEREQELLNRAEELLQFYYSHAEGWGTAEGSLSPLRQHFMEQLQECIPAASASEPFASALWLQERLNKLRSLYTAELSKFAQLSPQVDSAADLNQEVVVIAQRLLMAHERSIELASLCRQAADQSASTDNINLQR
ncbi:MAG: hypothetical protein ACI38Q_05335 [Candidatus Bruticola sp.]